MLATQKQIRSIILADDDLDDLEFFSHAVSKEFPGCTIYHVANGNELMQLLEHIYPDLLFLDLDMPVKNGLECVVDIRISDKLNQLPVVVFSSTTRAVNIQTAYEMGAHLFLIKSANYDEYANSLKAILNLDWRFPGKIKEQYCVNNRYTAFN
jgi:CheY-like chemotaxis protein